MATVVQFAEPVAANRRAYVLDIDASKTGSFEPTDGAAFKNYFAELRDFKDEIFFNIMTEEAINLWK